jgi:glycosyltransferase A (GT-A) superfamily protein (DUF2064 family)
MMSSGGPARPLHVLVMAKAPVAGKVKTRLCPPCSPQEAAAVAEAALADTLDAVVGCCAEVKVVALDGAAGPWLPSGLRVINQRGAGLAERLANAWADTRPWSGGCGIQIGMDTPQVTAWELDELLGMLRGQQPGALLGLARDGGWWVIGLPGTDPKSVFGGLPMSTSRTGHAQAERLRHLGLVVTEAPTRSDIDTFDDLLEVAAGLPGSRTAAVAAGIGIPGLCVRRGVA